MLGWAKALCLTPLAAWVWSEAYKAPASQTLFAPGATAVGSSWGWDAYCPSMGRSGLGTSPPLPRRSIPSLFAGSSIGLDLAFISVVSDRDLRSTPGVRRASHPAHLVKLRAAGFIGLSA